MGIALLCASFAWGGWVFLHSVGDPHRAERIATAILDDPAARAEIAAPLADQIVQNFSLPATYKTTIASTVADVLGDPAIVGNFIAAFGSAQANALGVNDPRPTTLDAGALINAVRTRLAVSQPQLAALIPDATASIDLPKVQSPVISKARSLASTWTVYLALIAVAIIVGLMILGDRRRVLRSYGFWAVLTGAFWAIGPRIAPWFAHQTAPQADALVGATVTAVAGPITTAATALVISGVIALVVRYAVLADRTPANPYPSGYDPYAVGAAPNTVLQPVMTGRATSYGLTRTDEVPVQPSAPYAQQQYQPQAYAQQPSYQSQQPQYAQTGPQPIVAEYERPHNRSTTIPGTQDELPRHDTAVPLLIRPLDLPTSNDLLFPREAPGASAVPHDQP